MGLAPNLFGYLLSLFLMSIRILSFTHRLPKNNNFVRQTWRKYSSGSTDDVPKRLIYTSPNIGLVKLAKVFSVSTLSVSALSTPALLYFWDSPAVQAADMTNSMFLGESLTQYVFSQLLLTAVAASACSTGALTYLMSPYVKSIYLHTKNTDMNSPLPPITLNSTISIETLDILSRCRTTTLRLRDLTPADSTFLTWKVNKKVLEKQYALEQTQGIQPSIAQHRFWLDQRNGLGNREAMSTILRVIEDQGRQRLI